MCCPVTRCIWCSRCFFLLGCAKLSRCCCCITPHHRQCTAKRNCIGHPGCCSHQYCTAVTGLWVSIAVGGSDNKGWGKEAGSWPTMSSHDAWQSDDGRNSSPNGTALTKCVLALLPVVLPVMCRVTHSLEVSGPLVCHCCMLDGECDERGALRGGRRDAVACLQGGVWQVACAWECVTAVCWMVSVIRQGRPAWGGGGGGGNGEL
jgi:hypothetical protein